MEATELSIVTDECCCLSELSRAPYTRARPVHDLVPIRVLPCWLSPSLIARIEANSLLPSNILLFRG